MSRPIAQASWPKAKKKAYADRMVPRIWGSAISDAYDKTEVPIKPAARPLVILASMNCHQFLQKISIMMVYHMSAVQWQADDGRSYSPAA
jgi:hypothetical protein